MTAADALVWGAILVVGLGTFVLRFSFLYLESRDAGLPPGAERALRFVPPAILAALILPAIVRPAGTIVVLGNDRLIAGAFAALVAWWTEDILATILAGVGLLLVVQLAF